MFPRALPKSSQSSSQVAIPNFPIPLSRPMCPNASSPKCCTEATEFQSHRSANKKHGGAHFKTLKGEFLIDHFPFSLLMACRLFSVVILHVHSFLLFNINNFDFVSYGSTSTILILFVSKSDVGIFFVKKASHRLFS